MIFRAIMLVGRSIADKGRLKHYENEIYGKSGSSNNWDIGCKGFDQPLPHLFFEGQGKFKDITIWFELLLCM